MESPPTTGTRRAFSPEPSPSFPLHPTRDEIASPYLGASATSPDMTKEQREFRGAAAPRPSSRASRTPSAMSGMSRTHMHRYTWWFEAISLIGSLVAIVVTAVVLRYFEGNPIPHWASAGTGLSLNSILSVLSTMSRASLLIPIDQSLGQLYWLAIAHRGRSLAEAEMYNEASRGPYGAFVLLWRRRGLGLTSMGCLLMIMSVALGFTQQQLISYPTHTQTHPDPLNLTKVGASLQHYDIFQETSQTPLGNPVPAVEFAVSSSLFASLNHYVVHDPLYRCDSGNCVYPVFATLGICSHCHDTHNEVVSQCDDDQDHCWANYKNLEGDAWRKTNQSAYSTIINQTINTQSVSIVETFTLNVSVSTWPPEYTAWACDIMWCVRSINASVTDSTYSETEVDEFTKATLQPDGTAVFSYDPGNEQQVINFTVAEGAQRAFKALGNTLTGWSRRTPTGQWVHSSALFGGMASFATADMTVGGKHMHRHKANPIAVMADGMSNAIRNQLVVVGDKVERRTIIQVRWYWLLYPAVMWLLSTVFLWGVVWTTKVNDEVVGAWGYSSIALLLWGVDEDVRDRVGDWNAERMERKARKITVKLARDGEGWKLKEVHGNAYEP